MGNELPVLYYFSSRSKRIWLFLLLFIFAAQLTFTLIFFFTIPVTEICITFSIGVFLLLLPLQIVVLIRWSWAGRTALEIHESGIAWRDQGRRNPHAFSWNAVTNFNYWKNDPATGIILVYLRHDAHPLPVLPMNVMLTASMERKFGTAFIIKVDSIESAPVDILEQLESWRDRFSSNRFTTDHRPPDEISRFMPH